MLKKIKTFIILFIFLFLDGNQIFSQNFVKIHGKVFNKDSVALPYTNIIIMNRYKGTIADKRGNFSFVCAEHDTLIFSHAGYKTRYFIIPETNVTDLEKDIFLDVDTVFLREVTVLPWKTYEEFKEAVLNTNPPETKKERAEKNILLAQLQMKYEDEVLDIPSPEASFRNYFYSNIVNPMYYRGQIRPISIFNPFAWIELFKAIQRGDFKKKEPPKYEDLINEKL
jgi:hypothetical protein